MCIGTLLKKKLGMENTHLSNSALKFAKPAKIVTYQQFYFSRKKKGPTPPCPSIFHPRGPFFSHGEIGSAERRANLAQNSSVIGHMKKLGTDIGSAVQFRHGFGTRTLNPHQMLQIMHGLNSSQTALRFNPRRSLMTIRASAAVDDLPVIHFF